MHARTNDYSAARWRSFRGSPNSEVWQGWRRCKKGIGQLMDPDTRAVVATGWLIVERYRAFLTTNCIRWRSSFQTLPWKEEGTNSVGEVCERFINYLDWTHDARPLDTLRIDQFEVVAFSAFAKWPFLRSPLDDRRSWWIDDGLLLVKLKMAHRWRVWFDVFIDDSPRILFKLEKSKVYMDNIN